MSKIDKLTLARKSYQEGKYSQAADLFEQAIADNPTLLNSAYGISLAHALILSLDWEKVAHYLPPEMNYLETSGWLKSLRFGKAVNNQLEPIPWYTYPAIEFIEDKVSSDFVVFEYGCGQSTLWWSQKVNHLTAIESNKEWFNYLQQHLIKDPKISLTLIEDEEEYIKAISHFPEEHFDVIIIDGDNRSRCAQQAYSRLKKDGLIIFDNTDRKTYDEALIFLEEQGFYRIDFSGLTPCLTYKNCTSVLFRNISLLQSGLLPSQKQSCTGKSYFQKNDQLDNFFANIDSLSIFEQLNLSMHNYIIFPEWTTDNELLAQEFKKIIINLVDEIKKDLTYTFLIYIGNENYEQVDVLIEEVILSLMIEDDLNIPDSLNIDFLPPLTEYQWSFLSQRIDKKIDTLYEDLSFQDSLSKKISDID